MKDRRPVLEIEDVFVFGAYCCCGITNEGVTVINARSLLLKGVINGGAAVRKRC